MKKRERTSKCPPQVWWKRLGGEYLLTNDAGEYIMLSPGEFRVFTGTGALPASGRKLLEMEEKGFLRERLDFESLSRRWKESNAYLDRGPGLHIFVLTLRCNHKCLYCQSGALREDEKRSDMDIRTARKILDFALGAPVKGLTIEFQGGEPLLNWEVLKETVLYGEKKAKASGKEIKFALVSNFSLMTKEKADFLIKHGVALCTSLDGPASLHDRNRIFAGGGSHALAVKWIKYFTGVCGKGSDCGPSALLTISKYSLGREKEIVEEYARLGLASIFVRPLVPIGFAGDLWDKIGCSPEEFTGFYKNSLGHVLRLNKKGLDLKEKTAFLLIKKAIGMEDNKYVDLRCPCGAGLGQLAYDFNGDVYTCDEGRMLAWQGDSLFKAGNVFEDAYLDVISSGAVKACAAASSLDSQPMCARCVWRPYCGICPVYNYQTQGSLWGDMPGNGRCRILKGIFETVFGFLKDTKTKEVFRKWLNS
ncbi:MAG: His-Xaa-Ser system radical SAM maturase HxsB [Elusimicrobia bacterium RIFOXYA12_FULL_51_18]|nr:MAG: His-Xaa-Ser system radical SAM maturase HxsB [Elusimicrobia bacterium RIFOXYA12_FULL_51_18]OGS32750.1 MAG: His-Xaa-Ser system radical SAM maturase HxsB [Elusimicrobia bacterium RIFOXYA2_FULL_53_38]